MPSLAPWTKKREPRDAVSPSEDVVLVGAPLPSGIGHHVLRKRGERLEAGSIKPLEEGKPIHGDLVRLKAREEPGLYDVQVEHAAAQSTGAQPTDVAARGPEERSGPAQVASDDYRRGWNRLFGASKSKTSN
jgi:hypothetical protein